MSTPQISIIVPIYNVEKYLRQCIDSVLAQSFSDFELLLVNDGSTDLCPVICDEYAATDCRIKVIHKPNGGLTSARNAGLEKARGEWIMHLDGDDWVEPAILQELIAKADTTGADIVMCDFSFRYESGQSVHQKIFEWKEGSIAELRQYIATVWTPVWGSIQRRKLYVDNQLRSPDDITYLEDFHLITRLCYYSDKISKVNKPLYNYRQQNASIMHTFNEKCVTDGMWVYEDTIRFFKQNMCYETFKDVMAWRSLNICLQMIFNPQKYEIIKNFNPDKKHFIFSCPLRHISIKARMMFYCITHGVPSVARLFLYLRGKTPILNI